MDDDLRDLLEPGDDRVAAALQRVRTDLLVGPDEVTAARHRRQRRSLTRRPALRRTAVAIVLAVVGTGAALTSIAPATVVPGSPAGQHGQDDPVGGVSSTAWFSDPADDPATHLPTFVDRLPAPAPAEPAARGGGDIPGDGTDPEDTVPGPPESPETRPGPPPHAPDPTPDARPTGPGPPAEPGAPADGDPAGRTARGRPDEPGSAMPDHARPDPGGRDGGPPSDGAPAAEASAHDAREVGAEPPPADDGR